MGVVFCFGCGGKVGVFLVFCEKCYVGVVLVRFGVRDTNFESFFVRSGLLRFVYCKSGYFESLSPYAPQLVSLLSPVFVGFATFCNLL